MPLKPNDEIQIASLIQAFLEAYSSQDLNTMMGCFAEDSDTVVIGASVAERVMGLNAIRASFARDIQQADAIGFEPTWQIITGSETAAWVIMECVVSITVQGVTSEIRSRWTLIVENREGFWLIRHSHFSIPIDAQPEGGTLD